MSLNKTIDGFCYRNDESLSDGDVQYQMYFHKISGASSPSKWNNVRTVESGASKAYYNANLGDADFLGQSGVVAAGDKVVVVFWKDGSDRTADCPTMKEWGAYEITLTTADVYTKQAQTKLNILPNLSWTFPTTGLVGQNRSSTHNSNDIHQWDWTVPGSGTTTMYHWYTRYGQTIFYVNQVNNTDYYWDDGNQDLNLPGVAVGTHSWSAPGTYDIDIVIEDECGGTVTGTKQIIITNNPPVPGIDCHQAVGQDVQVPDTVVTFEYDGTNPNTVITSIDWVIDDFTDTTTTGHAYTDIIPHPNGTGTDWYGHTSTSGAFTDHGTHNVAIVVHWWDGFNNQTINYSEDFYQLKFTGPTVSFTQAPPAATVGSGVSFTNTSTNTGRVGTDLPDGDEYDWTWDDDGSVEQELDKPYAYVLTKTPTTVDVNVELCANWQDGWDNQQTCVDQAVVFATTVTVTEVECYYEIDITGTSSDGSITGYDWDIYRSTSSGIVGPWELIWESPLGLDQKTKTICFTEENYFKIEGFVHGTGATTDDYEIIFVDETCASGVETVVSGVCAYILWNGTGPLDLGGDWTHGAHGSEEAYAMYEGTNGLDADGFTNNKQIIFVNDGNDDIGGYDFLAMWIYLNEWETGASVDIGFDVGNTVNLAAHVNTTDLGTWQRVLIPYEDLGLDSDVSTYPNKLTYRSGGDIGFYLDNVELVIGEIKYEPIEIHTPVMGADKAGDLSQRGREIGKPVVAPTAPPAPKPRMAGDLPGQTPRLGSDAAEVKPIMGGDIPKFAPPQN